MRNANEKSCNILAMLQLFLLAEKWESIAKEIFMLKEFLEAGRIVGTHGIKGELRVDPWCDSPDFLAQFKTLQKTAHRR